MKAIVDKETCIGCGLCTNISQAVFVMDDDGKAISTDIDLSGDNLKSAKEAEVECPVDAISVD